MIAIGTGTRPPKWETVQLDNGESFEILCRNPTYEEQLADLERPGGYLERRIQALVSDWRGVQNTAGNPVAFSWEALAMLCQQKPVVSRILARITSTRFVSATTEEAEKNSDGRPGDSSADTDSQNTPPSGNGST